MVVQLLLAAILSTAPQTDPEPPAPETPPPSAPEKAPANIAFPQAKQLGQPVAPPVTSAVNGPRPALAFGRTDGFHGWMTGQLRASYLGLQGFATDRDQTVLAPSPLETRVRLAPQLRYRGFGLVAEGDLVTGTLSGLPSSELRLGATPHPLFRPAELRQLYLEYKAETWVVRAGQQASNWGLGLVANNGGSDAAPGEFGDARFGDLTWRAALVGRPFYGMGGLWRAVEPILAADLIVRDDTADFSAGDRALQGVFALRFNADADRNFGVYTVYRRQRAVNGPDADARSTDAFVIDVAGRWKWRNEATGLETKLGAEAALITGRTTQSRADTAPEYALRQLGAVAKASVRKDAWEGYLDLGWASGDHNPYDAQLQGFRFDADYHAGLLLFREVLGWQTARTYARATDPDIAGVPPEGVELYPTRGAVHNAAYIFPRVRHAITETFDLYGGPLFALSTSSMTDPFASRLEGGTPRNALGGRPGRYLGTELDVGLQARLRPVQGMTGAATVEAGYLIPGAAFDDAGGNPMKPVAAARLKLSVGF